MTEFVSLDRGDGRAAGCSGSTRGAEGDTFKYEELFAANALLLGRVTYQGFAQAWGTTIRNRARSATASLATS